MPETPSSDDPAIERHHLMETVARVLAAGALRHDVAYRQIFANHPLVMWVYDIETLQILDANDAALKLYGYSYSEFTCLSLREIRPVEDVPKFFELTRELPHFDRSGPWRHRKHDGTVIQVLITSHSLTFGPHNARLVIVENPDEAPL
jgi:PAS domain S-box-containing protein